MNTIKARTAPRSTLPFYQRQLFYVSVCVCVYFEEDWWFSEQSCTLQSADTTSYPPDWIGCGHAVTAQSTHTDTVALLAHYIIRRALLPSVASAHGRLYQTGKQWLRGHGNCPTTQRQKATVSFGGWWSRLLCSIFPALFLKVSVERLLLLAIYPPTVNATSIMSSHGNHHNQTHFLHSIFKSTHGCIIASL